MEPFTKHTGLVAPLDRVNVDTDQMVPKQFLKLQTRQGYGRVLFFLFFLSRSCGAVRVEGEREPSGAIAPLLVFSSR